ncbi:MAG: hypothetical protein HGA96_06565 [Desulfobulbaceae bacterium]|nr:hypothetical protein [Desulfobulbaceae bacterium]
MTATRRTIYPPMIMLLAGGFFLFCGWAAFRANVLGSKVIDADYYSKGLKYNTSQVEKRAAETIGWNLETRLNGRNLEFHLTDRAGGGISRAAGTLYLAIPGSAENIYLPVQELAAGSYRVRLADNLKGTIQARLDLKREGAQLNRQLLLNL